MDSVDNILSFTFLTFHLMLQHKAVWITMELANPHALKRNETGDTQQAVSTSGGVFRHSANISCVLAIVGAEEWDALVPFSRSVLETVKCPSTEKDSVSTIIWRWKKITGQPASGLTGWQTQYQAGREVGKVAGVRSRAAMEPQSQPEKVCLTWHGHTQLQATPARLYDFSRSRMPDSYVELPHF